MYEERGGYRQTKEDVGREKSLDRVDGRCLVLGQLLRRGRVGLDLHGSPFLLPGGSRDGLDNSRPDLRSVGSRRELLLAEVTLKNKETAFNPWLTRSGTIGGLLETSQHGVESCRIGENMTNERVLALRIEDAAENLIETR